MKPILWAEMFCQSIGVTFGLTYELRYNRNYLLFIDVYSTFDSTLCIWFLFLGQDFGQSWLTYEKLSSFFHVLKPFWTTLTSFDDYQINFE